MVPLRVNCTLYGALRVVYPASRLDHSFMPNVITLAIAQAFAASGIMVVVLMGSLASTTLAPSPAWATAPVSISVIAMALSTIPAALLMRRIGRRAGLIVGAGVGVCGGLVAAFGIASGAFIVFCVGAMLLGSTMAFTQQYRFAAAESAAPERVSRAVSYVLIGSLGAALLGPQVALFSRTWIEEAPYAGSFLAVGGLYVVAIAILTRLQPIAPAASKPQTETASVAAAQAHSHYRIAVCASLVAYAVMSFLMTAAPVNMHAVDHHSVETTTWVIQSHVLAMYLPSLLSGRLIERFGERSMMLGGAALMAACVGVNLSGHHVMHYWWGLVLLGVGWNLLFVAGTILLTRSLQGPDRFRKQAIADFAVFGSQACASLIAGFAVQALGWTLLNAAALPLIFAMMIAAMRLSVVRVDRAQVAA